MFFRYKTIYLQGLLSPSLCIVSDFFVFVQCLVFQTMAHAGCGSKMVTATNLRVAGTGGTLVRLKLCKFAKHDFHLAK